MELVPIKKLVYCAFEIFFPDYLDSLEFFTIGWRYYPPISKLFLNGKDVFKDFSWESHRVSICDCSKFKRFKPFLCEMKSENGLMEVHVRSLDIYLFRHPKIRK